MQPMEIDVPHAPQLDLDALSEEELDTLIALIEKCCLPGQPPCS